MQRARKLHHTHVSGTTVRLKEGAHIGHGAIIHGGTIGKNVLVGMNAVVMDNCVIGDGCIVGALSFVPAETSVPDRKIIAGNPAQIKKELSDKMLDWKTKGTALYQALPKEMHDTFKEVEPLTRPPKYKPKQESLYATWDKIKKA